MNLGNANEWNRFANKINGLWNLRGAGNNVQVVKSESNAVITMQDGDELNGVPRGFVFNDARWLGYRITDWRNSDLSPIHTINEVGHYDEWDVSHPNYPFGRGYMDDVYRIQLSYYRGFDILSMEFYGLSTGFQKGTTDPGNDYDPRFPPYPVPYNNSNYPGGARMEWLGYVSGTKSSFQYHDGIHFTGEVDSVFLRDPSGVKTLRRFTGTAMFEEFNTGYDDIYHWMDPPPALHPIIQSAEPPPGGIPGPYLETDDMLSYVRPMAVYYGGSPYGSGVRLNYDYTDSLKTGLIGRKVHTFYLTMDSRGSHMVHTLPNNAYWPKVGSNLLEKGTGVLVLNLKLTGRIGFYKAAVGIVGGHWFDVARDPPSSET